MDGANQNDVLVGEGVLSFLSSFSAERIAALHLHTLMPIIPAGWSFSGGRGGLEQLAYLTIQSHFHLHLHQEKV